MDNPDVQNEVLAFVFLFFMICGAVWLLLLYVSMVDSFLGNLQAGILCGLFMWLISLPGIALLVSYLFDWLFGTEIE